MNTQITIMNELGLHARPASMFVKEATKYKSEVFVEADGKRANAKSILSILSLGISKGKQINIITEGVDEKYAMEAMLRLIESKFGEDIG